MATDLQPSAQAQTSGPKYELFVETQLVRARRRIRMLDLTMTGLGFVILTLAYGLLMTLCDRWLELSALSRQIAFVTYLLGAIAYIALAVVRPLLIPINPYYAARKLEETLPSAKNSVINWVDLSQEPLAPAFRQAIGNRAARDLKSVNLEQAIDARRVSWVGWATTGLFAGVVLFYLSSPRQFPSLLQRSFAPFVEATIATRTKLTIVRPESRDATIPIGRGLTFVVSVDGRVPEAGAADAVKLLYRHSQADSYEERPFEQGESRREWTIALRASDVQHGLWYKVVGGDDETEEYQVQVHSTPLATGFDITYRYRPYLKWHDRKAHDPNLQDLVGTKVDLVVHTNRTIREGQLSLPGETPLTGELVAGEPQSLRFTLVLEKDSSYQIWFTSTDGERNAEPVPYSIRVTHDQPPQIELTAPGQDIRLPANGILSLEGAASDDFGVAGITLLMKLSNGVALQPRLYRAGKSLQLADGGYPQMLDYKDFVDLAKLKDDAGVNIKLEGTQLEYWLEAKDNCDFPGPNVAQSKHFRVVVEPPKNENQAKEDRKEAEKKQERHEEKQDQKLNQQHAPQQPNDQAGEERPQDQTQPPETKQDPTKKQDSDFDQQKQALEKALKDQQQKSGDGSEKQQNTAQKPDGKDDQPSSDPAQKNSSEKSNQQSQDKAGSSEQSAPNSGKKDGNPSNSESKSESGSGQQDSKSSNQTAEQQSSGKKKPEESKPDGTGAKNKPDGSGSKESAEKPDANGAKQNSENTQQSTSEPKSGKGAGKENASPNAGGSKDGSKKQDNATNMPDSGKPKSQDTGTPGNADKGKNGAADKPKPDEKTNEGKSEAKQSPGKNDANADGKSGDKKSESQGAGGADKKSDGEKNNAQSKSDSQSAQGADNKSDEQKKPGEQPKDGGNKSAGNENASDMKQTKAPGAGKSQDGEAEKRNRADANGKPQGSENDPEKEEKKDTPQPGGEQPKDKGQTGAPTNQNPGNQPKDGKAGSQGKQGQQRTASDRKSGGARPKDDKDNKSDAPATAASEKGEKSAEKEKNPGEGAKAKADNGAAPKDDNKDAVPGEGTGKGQKKPGAESGQQKTKGDGSEPGQDKPGSPDAKDATGTSSQKNDPSKMGEKVPTAGGDNSEPPKPGQKPVDGKDGVKSSAEGNPQKGGAKDTGSKNSGQQSGEEKPSNDAKSGDKPAKQGNQPGDPNGEMKKDGTEGAQDADKNLENRKGTGQGKPQTGENSDKAKPGEEQGKQQGEPNNDADAGNGQQSGKGAGKAGDQGHMADKAKAAGSGSGKQSGATTGPAKSGNNSGPLPPEVKPGAGADKERVAAQPNKEFADKAGQLQLEDFKKRVNKDVLRKANMTDADYQKFLKAYEDMLQRQQADRVANEKLSAPLKTGATLPNQGVRRVDAGVSDKVNKAEKLGPLQAPPEFQESQREFSRRLLELERVPDQK